ncbi:MAG: PA domain-containing protein [Flavobacteriaceae bacterium]
MKKFTLLIAMLLCFMAFGQKGQVDAKSIIAPTKVIETPSKKQVATQTALPYKSVTSTPQTFIDGLASRNASKKAKKIVSSQPSVAVNKLENQSPKMQAVVNKFLQLGSQTGNLSDYFSTEEIQLLRAFYGPRKIITGVQAGPANTLFTSSGKTGTEVINNFAGTSSTTTGQNRMPVVITHSVTQNITPGSVTCNAGGLPTNNSFFRAFDLANDFGIAGDFEVTDVEFAIEAINGPINITLNVYSTTNTFPTGWPAGYTLQGTATASVDAADALTVVSAPLVATIPAGEVMIYEMFIPDQQTSGFVSFFPGSNADGQTDPSYIMAADCGLATPGDLAGIGFPNQHMVMNVVGDEAGGGGGGGPVTAYGYESQTISFGSYESANPGVYTQIATSPNDPGTNFEGAGAIDPNGDGTTAYALSGTSNTLYSIDIATGVYTSLGTVTAPGGGGWVGAEFDPTTGTLYGLSGVFTSNVTLSTIDIGTLTVTPIGTDSGSACAVTFAIDSAGVGYLTDVCDDSLWAVDLATGAHTLVGPTGIDLNFGQGMCYDVNTDQLYTAAFNNLLFTSEWRTVNTTTGATTLVGAINVPNLTQMGWVGMPDAGGGGGGGGCATGVYTDRPSFDAEAATANFEDLAGGPGAISGCDAPFSAAGNSCYAAGEIIDGIEILSSDMSQVDPVAYFPAGSGFNVDDAVGSNYFVDYTIINFPNNDVNAFGLDIYGVFGGGSFEVRIFGTGGLITTETVSVAGSTPTFFGYIADETIVSVEIEDPTLANAEFVAQIAFGECTGGGGGGNDCNQEHPLSANVGGGVGSSVNSDFKSASDITVAPGEQFTIDTIDAVFLTIAPNDPPTTANIVYYTDNGGFPGSVIGSETVVPTIVSSAPWANPVADQYITTMSVTPFTFAGDPVNPTSYWIEISMGTATSQPTVFWEYNRDGVEGFPLAQFDGTAGTWSYPDLDGDGNPDLDAEVIYNYAGTCDPLVIVTYDDCEGALSISCGDTVMGDTLSATVDSVDDCTAGTTDAPGVWYKWEDTSGLAADVLLSTCSANTDYDTQISVFTGPDCNNLTCVAGNDDSPNCTNFQSEVEFESDGNSTYYILVYGFGSATGNFELSMTCTLIPPPNDDIVNAIDLDEVGCPFTDVAVAMPAATLEGGTPTDCDITGAAGVWYKFTPEGDGFITGTIATPGPGVGSTNLSVNNGPLAGDYNPVAALFGGPIPINPLTEDAVVVIDDDTTGDANDACDPILNGADLNGKIAVLRRGSCEFGFKALAAQNEGAVAVVVVNNQPGDPIEMGGGAVGDQVTIPVVMISDVEGEPIIAELLASNTVNMTLSATFADVSSVTFYTAPDETSSENELVLVDYFQNQCVPGVTATIPTVAGQAYYCFVVNTGAISDIIFDNCDSLGVDSNEIEGFAFYPNPASDKLNLTSLDTIEKVALYNILGQQVIALDVNATTTQVDISNLSVGAYIMKVTSNGQTGTYKVVKK